MAVDDQKMRSGSAADDRKYVHTDASIGLLFFCSYCNDLKKKVTCLCLVGNRKYSTATQNHSRWVLAVA